MNSIQKTGSVAGFGLGIAFLALIGILLYLPSLGLGPGELSNPAKGIPFLETSPLPASIAYLYLLSGAAVGVLGIALSNRLREAAPVAAQIMLAAGIGAAVLFAAYAMIDLVTLPSSAALSHTDAALGAAEYATARSIGNALSAAALLATGIVTALAGYVGLRSKRLPILLAGLMIVAGLAAALSFVVLPLGLLAVLLAPVWAIWLGFALRRP